MLAAVAALASLLAASGPQTNTSGIEIDFPALFAACGNPTRAQLDALSSASRHALVACVAAEGARQLNRAMPLQIDKSTIAERIDADDTTIVYHYRGAMRAADLPPAAFEAYKQRLRTRICAGNTRAMIDLGGSYRMIWNDRDGAPIGELFVDAC